MTSLLKVQKVMTLSFLVGATVASQGVYADEKVEQKSTETRSSSEQSGSKRAKKAGTKKKTTVTTSSTIDGKDPNSVDYQVQAEKTKAAAKVDAADAKVEAAETRAKAKIEATETKAKAQVEATETRTKAEKDAVEQRAAAEKEATETRANSKSSDGPTAGLFERSGRIDHKFGAYVSLWGDPFPAPIGVNVGYNLTDYLRTTIGVGSNDDRTFSLSTFGVGVKGMVPKWAITPVLGINLSTTTGGGKGAKTIRGFDPSGTRLYGTAGVEWQTGLGLNFGAGYALSSRSGEDGTVYFNVGLFL